MMLPLYLRWSSIFLLLLDWIVLHAWLRLSFPLFPTFSTVKGKDTHTQIYKITQNKRLNGSTSKSTSLIGRQFIFLFFISIFCLVCLCLCWIYLVYSVILPPILLLYYRIMCEILAQFLFIHFSLHYTHIIIVILVSYTFDDGR